MARVTYTIPDHLTDQPYVPTYNMPNASSFRANNLKPSPIPPLGLDNVAQWTSDALQDIATTIASIEAGAIGVTGDQNDILYYTGDQWANIPLQNLLNTVGALTLDGSNILINTIPGTSIRSQTLMTAQYSLNSVTTPIIADEAITASKLAKNSISLSKFIPPTSPCLIGGTTTNSGSWYPVVLGDWQIAAKKPQNNGPTAVSLVDVWGGTNGTFDGSKISAATIPLGSIVSSQSSCILVGGSGENIYSELTLQPFEVASVLPEGLGPIAMTLDQLWGNTANSFDGAKITNNSLSGNKILDNSIGSSKLNNAGQMIPLAMGYVLSDGTVQKSLNVAYVNRTGIGTYLVEFVNSAVDAKYIVTFGTQSVNNYYINAEVAQNSQAANGFTVNTGYGQTTVDCEFYFIVYSF